MAGKPKRRSTRIGSLTQLEAGVPSQVTPLDQIAPYYGGREAALDAIFDADQLQRQVYPAMSDIDPEMREMFPPFDTDNYRRPSTILPVNDGDPTGPLAVPVGYMDRLDQPDVFDVEQVAAMLPGNFRTGSVVNLNKSARDFQLLDPNASSMEALSHMVEQPMTTNVTDPMGVNYLPGDIRGTPLIPNDEASALAQMLMDSDGFDAGELGGSEYDSVAQAIRDRSRPFAVDQALAQLRRAEAPTGGQSAFANALLDANIDGTRALMQGQYPGKVMGKSGLNVADLIALTALPQRVRKFLPTRMGMIPSVMGATTAAGATAYGMSQDPNMLGRSTMGGASY